MHFIMAQQGFVIINYIDDFCGIAASEERTHAGFLLLKATLATLGLHEALDKSPPPPPPLVAGPGIWLHIQPHSDTRQQITAYLIPCQ